MIARHRRIGILALTVALLAPVWGASAASAHSQPHPKDTHPGYTGWWNGELTGNCGLTDSNYVRSLQHILLLDGDYDNSSGPGTIYDVTGTWNTRTNGALAVYQYRRGLTIDSCAGYATWHRIDDELAWINTACTSPPAAEPTNVYWWTPGSSSSHATYQGYSPYWFNVTYHYWFDGWREVTHANTGPTGSSC